MSKPKFRLILLFIFVLALFVRFYAFRESIYFAYDQARDIYAAIDIYKGHLKFIGPPVTGNVGLFHGVLFWYLLGPIHFLLGGDPVLVSAVFRILNACGVFLIFSIGSTLFSSTVGLLAAFTYAISYEQSQFAMYVGNPSLGVLAVLIMFLGFSWLITPTKNKNWSLSLILSGAALGAQFNFMFWYLFALAFVLLFISRSSLKSIPLKYKVLALLISLLLTSSFLITELKYHFRSITTTLDLLNKGYAIMDKHDSKYLLYLNKFFLMFQDNFVGRHLPIIFVVSLVVTITVWLIFKSRNDRRYLLLLFWQFGWTFLMILGGHTAYYTNAGLSVGLIFSTLLFFINLNRRIPCILPIFLLLTLIANIKAIRFQSPKSVNAEFITQDAMKLSDEINLINYMYSQAEGQGFTVRQTGIPYQVQTTWAYLFKFYGQRRFGYLPFWETPMVLGFDGELPTPNQGTTCLRFRLVEPTRGLPQNLIIRDTDTENELSILVESKNFGQFLVEKRLARDPHCHDRKP